MSAFIELLNTYSFVTILIFLVLIFESAKWIAEGVKFVKKAFESYHSKKTGEEKKEETVSQRITKLEEHDAWQYQELQQQSKLLLEMKELISEMKTENDKNIVATNRSTLNIIATEVIARGYITQVEYETFKDLSDIYIAKGGNHTMKDKVIPQVLNLPIK